MINKLFKLRENGTSIRQEVFAGLTTFMSMAYILAINPDILSIAGASKESIFAATALASCFACLLMGLLANLPIGLAPSMGLNSFFAVTVVTAMGHSFAFALVAVFISGILFMLMSIFNIREAIVDAIPKNLKISLSVGIGLFITIVGLKSSGVIVGDPNTLLTMGDLSNSSAILGFIGIAIAAILLTLKVPGAILISIIAATIVGIPLGVTHIPENFNPISTSIGLTNHFGGFDWSQILTFDMLIVVLTFMFVSIFDVVGTLIGVCSSAKILDKNGNVPNIKKALFSDALATTVGAALGTSTVGSYVESATGVIAGGRTGLTAVTVGGMFLCSLLFAPIFLIIPGAATCCALVMVGLFMLRGVTQIEFDELSEAIPAFLTIIFIPLSYSIANGIMIGIISYVIINLAAGNYQKLTPTMMILAAVFLAKFVWL